MMEAFCWVFFLFCCLEENCCVHLLEDWISAPQRRLLGGPRANGSFGRERNWLEVATLSKKVMPSANFLLLV